MGLFEELFGMDADSARAMQGCFDPRQCAQQQQPLSPLAREAYYRQLAGMQAARTGRVRWRRYANLNEALKPRKKVESRTLSPEEAVKAAADAVVEAQKLLP